ncbi:hypothetical protein ACIQPR_43535 [Streptomyces sp. NPDC091280]|uniref:hypothetical protein n=1 Tax=Streptomyces sp. NPDC091280 TaxID=3365984 RepID=UPI003813E0C7
MFDYSPADDNSEAAWVDSQLYMDQSSPDFPTMNGYGPLIINVVSVLDGKETDLYEGTDEKEAARLAINAFERSYRKAEVLVMRDGGSWKYVFAYPRVVQDAKPVVIDAGFCPDPRCGEINPLDCWCRFSMTPEEIKRYAQYD